jgi:hypothetical protein
VIFYGAAQARKRRIQKQRVDFAPQIAGPERTRRIKQHRKVSLFRHRSREALVERRIGIEQAQC